MGEVVDLRPDRFLSEMRKHGDWNKACEGAGLSRDEVNVLCDEDARYDFSVVSGHLAFIEESMKATMEASIATSVAAARKANTQAFNALRRQAVIDFTERRRDLG